MALPRTKYYSLYCKQCKVQFRPVLATSPGELLYPDFDVVEEEAGVTNRDALSSFHSEHQGHKLITKVEKH